MNLLKKSFALMLLFPTLKLQAQEWNLGVHLNPALTIAKQTEDNAGNPALRMREHTRFGFNTGLNAKYRKRRWGVESGLNLIHKSVGFVQNTFPGLAVGNTQQYYSGISTFSVEVPLLASYAFYQHRKKRWYDLELVAGGGYEWLFANSYLTIFGANDSYQGTITSSTQNSDIDAILATRGQWANAVLGLQLRTTLSKLGPMELGVLYHHPFGTLSYADRFTMSDGQGNTATYAGRNTFRAGYLDFKAAFYFLNFRKGEGRVRYR